MDIKKRKKNNQTIKQTNKQNKTKQNNKTKTILTKNRK